MNRRGSSCRWWPLAGRWAFGGAACLGSVLGAASGRADPAQIGIYEDPAGQDCTLPATGGVLQTYYVVVTPPTGGGFNGVEFSAPIPECFIGSLVSETVPDGFLAFGDTQSGIAIASPTCLEEPTVVLTITLFSPAPPYCCAFPVLGRPGIDPTPMYSDCQAYKHVAEGMVSMINADESCPCGSPDRGTIRIEKQTAPAGRTGFRFTHDIDGSGPFTLDDGDVQEFFSVPSGIYNVAEDDPLSSPGSIPLHDIVCQDSDSSGLPSVVDLGARTATVYLDPYETVTCTFINGADCNTNGVEDALELADEFVAASELMFFTSQDGQISYVLEGPPSADEPGAVQFEVEGFLAPSGYVVAEVNGTWLGEGEFVNSGCDSQSTTIDVPSESYNAAVAAGGGDANVVVSIVGDMLCEPLWLAQVVTSYSVDQQPDCNADGVPDECDLAAGTSEDCNVNARPDECDIASGSSMDCNSDGTPDECQLAGNDCNSTSIPDDCEIAGGTSVDCQPDGIPDECQLAGNDCNATGVPDDCDIYLGLSNDCFPDGIPDECQPDCNTNGRGDDCDIFHGTSLDCNTNGRPDECDLALSPGNISLMIAGADDSAHFPVSELLSSGYIATVGLLDITTNEFPDLATLSGYDAILVYTNGAPDEPVSLGDVLADYVDAHGRLAIATYAYSDPLAIGGRIMTTGYSPLVNTGTNGAVGPALIPTVPDDPIFEDIDVGGVSYFKNTFFAHAGLDAGATLLAKDASDVNMIARNAAGNVYGLNLYPASHPSNNAEFYRLLARILTFPGNGSRDCQDDGIPDECQVSESDCNMNAIPDECDIAAATSVDCLPDGVPDECQPDCNANGIGDDCDTLPGGSSSDCQGDGVPDECQLTNNDCNTNGVPDECDTMSGTSLDCQPDGIPDECQLGPGQDCNFTGVPDTCESWGRGDIDGDFDSDLNDFALFVEVMTGPNRDVFSEYPDCWFMYHFVFDYNVDFHIDLADFAVFQREFTGP